MRRILALTGMTIALVSAAVWLGYRVVGMPLTGIDDANIFPTYAQNLAAGRGLTYTVTGERVEGFTSMA